MSLNTPDKAPLAVTADREQRDLLGRYLKEIRAIPLLSEEQELALVEAYYQGGDEAAGEALVRGHLRLVTHLAFKHRAARASALDLIQEGNLGLLRALEKFDPERGIRFASYARYWIRARILNYLMANHRLVNLATGRDTRRLFFQLQKERDRLVRAGVDPSAKLIAENLGVSEKEVHAVDRHMRAPALSLHAPTGDGDDGRSLAEVVPDNEPNDPEDNAARTELSGLVQGKLAAFAAEQLRDEREQIIWSERMLATDPVSLASLGERFGVSKERVRQIEARMKKRLKQFLEAELGDEIDFEFS